MESNKIIPFEYLVSKLVEWNEETERENDLSILKVLKLLFFISAINTTEDSEDTLLDNVFDNYVAMPYGHVESDIYNLIKEDAFFNIEINNSTSTVLNATIPIDPERKSKIDDSLSYLKKINPYIINYSSFELVELSHSWYSWQKYFQIAKDRHIASMPIPNDEIKKEDKIFQL